MNKTVYLREEEVPIWEEARELAGEKLSPIIVAALKQFIVASKAEPKGFQRLVVSYNDSNNNGIPSKKAFWGRWIFSPDEPLKLQFGNERQHFAVAVTQKTNYVAYHWEPAEVPDFDNRWCERFVVFGSLEEMAKHTTYNLAARAAMEKIGVPVEELDI